MITLTYGVTSIELPADLAWADEFAWSAIAQRSEYTITGALAVEEAAKQAGRPITLEGDDVRAWVSRATLLTLQAWARLPGQTFTLSIHGTAYTVLWDQARGPIAAAPKSFYTDTDPADDYVVSLRFIEV